MTMPLKRLGNIPCSLALVALGVACSQAAAGPTIDRINIEQSEITLAGSGFGQGPTVMLYDDFSQAKQNGDNVELNPQVGSWYYHRQRGENGLVPGIDGSDSQSLVARRTEGDTSHQISFGVEDESGIHGLKHFQEVYFSYTIKDGRDFPGPNGGRENFSDVSSTKDAWMMFGRRGDNIRYSVESLGEPNGHDLYVPSWTGGSFTIAGNGTNMNPHYAQTELRDEWDFGGWVTKMFHGKLDPDDPYGEAEGFFAFLNENAFHVNPRRGNLMTDQTNDGVPYPYWDRIKFFTWLRQGDADVERLLDNVYVAIGEHANARVLLTDAKSIEESSMVMHLTPNMWSSDKIVVPTPNSDTEVFKFIHIISSNNEISNSIQLTCPKCPERPTSLSVD